MMGLSYTVERGKHLQGRVGISALALVRTRLLQTWHNKPRVKRIKSSHIIYLVLTN